MAERRISWRTLVAIGAMLAAILAYVASLDDTDPDPLEPVAPAQAPSP